jgi:hypothetical protein
VKPMQPSLTEGYGAAQPTGSCWIRWRVLVPIGGGSPDHIAKTIPATPTVILTDSDRPDQDDERTGKGHEVSTSLMRRPAGSTSW